MTVEELFKQGNGTLTLEQFTEITNKNNVNFADVSGYVSKEKYDNDVTEKEKRINELNDTISARDTDLASIKEQLSKANADGEALNKLRTALEELQGKYNDEKQAYENRLKEQAYSFAVKEFANSKKFSSAAAQRDFESTLLNKKLSLENGKILGAEDFLKAYSEANADAFINDDTTIANKRRLSGSTTHREINTITKEQFAKMSYSQRNELYNTDRELYNSLK